MVGLRRGLFYSQNGFHFMGYTQAQDIYLLGDFSLLLLLSVDINLVPCDLSLSCPFSE